tara:strand:+ start:1591 stop:1878 length:288 start_codon:yes stop_codon:yes gene_type:complete
MNPVLRQTFILIITLIIVSFVAYRIIQGGKSEVDLYCNLYASEPSCSDARLGLKIAYIGIPIFYLVILIAGGAGYRRISKKKEESRRPDPSDQRI